MTPFSPAGGLRLLRVLAALLALALPHCPLQPAALAETEEQAEERTKLLGGESIVRTIDLDNGITRVTGKILIDAPPEDVWTVITDYNNHQNFIPKVLESRLLSNNGTRQVLYQRGKSGMLFFRKTVQITLQVESEPVSRISFKILEGDFRIYQGNWLLEALPGKRASMLTFEATIQPDFFAPSFFVRSVQKNDLPKILEAVKLRSESLHGLAYSADEGQRAEP